LAASVAYENLRDEYFPFAVFLIVRSHHGELQGASNAFDELYDLLNEEDRHSILMKQLDQLKSSEQEILKEVSRLEYPLASIPSDVDDVIQKLKKDARRFAVEAEENWDRFFLTELLFSSLIDSDKKSAAGLSSKQVCIPKVSELGRKIELLPKSGNLLLDEYRSLLQRLVLERVSQGGFTYIISPTGTGKTMAGLLAAVEKGKRRLIYALPYINIVEQTHSALARALGSDSLEVLLKYHHLAIPYIASRASEEQIELDKLLLMADSWDSYAVVTTFEGLFASLVSSKNLLLKKLHNIAGSVLILDEVQAIPMEYWKLVKDVLIRASKLLNIDVILMTATMPSMFLRGSGLDSVIEPVGLPPLNRYVLRFNGGNLSADELAERFLAKWDMRTSSLIVLNTVRSAERVYLNIKETLGDKVRILTSSSENTLDKPWITYLSDHVVPYERKKRIDRIKDEMKKGTPVVLVSTQVVEAGVDLDFGYAIRDFGPLDSIVQVAGRCNRNASKERSVVDVFYVSTDNKTDFSKIYGAALEDATVDVLDHEAKFN
ncbi:MAG: CRISPR-associated helicase Cas3', partial [Nanoarchaeota archaeon]|nr:CRISPR-associated helicase Cas3' [Nanoarchaeota archaeon]